MSRIEIKCGERLDELKGMSNGHFCLWVRRSYGSGAPIGNMTARNLVLVDSSRVYPTVGFRRNFFISFRRELEIQDDDFLLCPADTYPGIIFEFLVRMVHLSDVYVVGSRALERVFGIGIKPGTPYPVEAETLVSGEVRRVHIYPSYCTWVRKRGVRNAVIRASN
jgi:hypothetical protein